MNSRSFNISEQHDRGDHSWSWRLKDNEIRFRGTGDYAHLVTRRIPADDSQLDSLKDAFDLLNVWEWRDNYHSHDANLEVLGGSSWTFDANWPTRKNHAAGSNGYPSFGDPVVTALSGDRFSLLHAAIYSIFGIDHYIKQAQQYTQPSAPGDR